MTSAPLLPSTPTPAVGESDIAQSETWSPIPGFALYDASTLGHVRSWNQRGRKRHGVRATAPRLPTLSRPPDGYVAVRIPRDAASSRR
jgi:hypothetical protein